MNIKLNIYIFYLFLFINSNSVIARTEKIKASLYEIEFLETSIYNFKNDVGRFPTQDEGLKSLIMLEKNIHNWKGPYINKLNLPLDSWGHEYIYLFPSKYGSKEYDLYSYGEDGVDQYGLGDDITNWKTRKPD